MDKSGNSMRERAAPELIFSLFVAPLSIYIWLAKGMDFSHFNLYLVGLIMQYANQWFKAWM